MGRIVILQLCRARIVLINGLCGLHLGENTLECFVKHLASPLNGMIAVHIDGTQAVAHAHTGGGIAINCRLHGNVVLGELVAGLGVIGILVHRIQIDLNTELLQLILDHFRIAHMGFLCGVHRQREGSNLSGVIDVESVCVLFGITGSFHIFLGLCRVSCQLLGLLIANSGLRNKAPVGNLGVCAAKVSLESIVIQCAGNCLTEIFVRKQSLCIVECQYGRGIGRGNIDQRNFLIVGQNILVSTGNPGGIAPHHVHIALLQCQIHGILIAKQAIDDLFHVGFLRIVGVDGEGKGSRLLTEGFQDIGTAGDPRLCLGDAVLALINVLGHDAERGHIAQLPDIGCCQCQRNAGLIRRNGVFRVLCLGGFAVGIGLCLKICAAVGLVIFQRKEDVLRSYGFSVGPGHSLPDGIGPGLAVLRGEVRQQRMKFAICVLTYKRHLRNAAGKHIEVVFPVNSGFDCGGSSHSDGFHGVLRLCLGCGGRFCRGGRCCGSWCLRCGPTGSQGQSHHSRKQQCQCFLHHFLFSFFSVLLSNT